jgi:hypothetical protein
MPPRSRLTDPRHELHRARLRTFGWLCTATGAIATGIGLVSFFGAMGPGRGQPDLFWCAFLGLPLLGLGGNLLRMGYAGALARYHARETMPVATDALDHVAEHGHGALRTIGGALAGKPRAAADRGACTACGAAVGADARFCQQCGKELAPAAPAVECARCRHDNAPGARFCAGCGGALAT